MKKSSIKIVLKSKINKFGLESKEVKALEEKVTSKLDVDTWNLWFNESVQDLRNLGQL